MLFAMLAYRPPGPERTRMEYITDTPLLDQLIESAMAHHERPASALTPDLDNEPEERSSHVLSVIKAFGLLETVLAAPTGLSLKELCAHNALHPSTAYRLLHTMIEIGYVRQDARTRRYHSGARAHILAHPDHKQLDLQAAAMPHLQALAEQIKETASLYILEDHHVVHLTQAEAPNSVQMVVHVGARMPIYSTASGKALLANIEPANRNHLLQQLQLEQRTPNTLTTFDDLRVELDRIRRRNFAVDDEEQEIGMRSVAAIVRDAAGQAIAAVNVSGPSGRISVHRLMELSQQVQDTAAHISRQLGYVAPSLPHS